MECMGCGKVSMEVTRSLGLCRDCIDTHFETHRANIELVHHRVRFDFNMPLVSPRNEDGILCDHCARSCSISPGDTGYCGVRANRGGDVSSTCATPGAAYVTCRLDILPATCAADWTCPGCADVGYPDYSHRRGPETGYKKLVVSYQSCNFNCLFCGHWEFRENALPQNEMTPEQVADLADQNTACVCFTGGDATPQMEHSLQTADLLRRRFKGRVMRLCWETNGSARHAYTQRLARLAYESGGVIKVDIKAFSPRVHFALCGVGNKQVLNTVKSLQKVAAQRPDAPLVAASTVLVPGYAPPAEIWHIARFLASNNPNTPYALLGFFPHFYFHDLPPTSDNHAQAARDAALHAGLRNVHIGNAPLISEKDYVSI